jgi:hypothetical protein
VSDATAKKEERRKFQAIRGTRDLLPSETALWNRVEQTAHEVFSTFGYGEIRLPIFEPTELFARAVGGETDIVSKEMYTFAENPGVSSLEGLRTEAVQLFSAYKNNDNELTEGFFIHSVDSLIRSISRKSDDGDFEINSQLQSDLAALIDRADF